MPLGRRDSNPQPTGSKPAALPLSYTPKGLEDGIGETGFEPATSCVQGRRYYQTERLPDVVQVEGAGFEPAASGIPSQRANQTAPTFDRESRRRDSNPRPAGYEPAAQPPSSFAKVEEVGFEPTAPWSQARCANQTAPFLDEWGGYLRTHSLLIQSQMLYQLSYTPRQTDHPIKHSLNLG